jgi:hypothetical protein
VCEAAGIDPVIAVARDEHNPDWRERDSEPAPLPEKATTPVQALSHRLKSKAGRALHALRKQTVEPVFRITRSVMGFRQFSPRGLNKVRGERTLICLTWNLKRMARLRLQEGKTRGKPSRRRQGRQNPAFSLHREIWWFSRPRVREAANAECQHQPPYPSAGRTFDCTGQ